MITTVSELKDLILWAKEQKLVAMTIDGVSFQFSEAALLTEAANLGPDLSQPRSTLDVQSSLLQQDGEMSKDEYEDLLFASARP